MHYRLWLPWIYSLKAWRWLKRESKHVALNCILCNKLLCFDWYFVISMYLITYFNVTAIFNQKFHFVKRKHEGLWKARCMELLVAGSSNMRYHVDYINRDLQTSRVTIKFFFVPKAESSPQRKLFSETDIHFFTVNCDTEKGRCSKIQVSWLWRRTDIWKHHRIIIFRANGT